MSKRKVVSVAEIIILILIALAFAVVAWRQNDWQIEIRFILMAGAIIFLAVAIMAIIIWMRYGDAVVEEQRQKAYSCSERVRLVMELAHLNAEQIAALGQYAPVVELAGGGGSHAPIQVWRLIGGGTTTIEFIRRYIEMGDDVNLCAIRDVADSDRETVRQIIADFVQRGFCRPPRGNLPAQWIDKAGAMVQLFGREA
jgi:hypothetical protein